ncbi:hypothetical protein U1Q18_034101 [Sarracenia purpurea var. burkii]
MGKPFAPFRFSLLFLALVAVTAIVTSEAQQKVCYERFTSVDPAKCIGDCQRNFPDHLLNITVPTPPANTNCICEYKCYIVSGPGNECICPFAPLKATQH